MDNNNNRKSERVGALWDKISKKDGMSFMSGVIKINDKDIKISIFRNTRKTQDNHPDWTIMSSEDVGNTPYVKS